MQALGEYIVSVSAAAFVCAIVSGLMPKGSAKEILRLVGGLFLAFTVIRPVADIQIPDLTLYGQNYQREAEQAVRDGEDMVQAAVAERIKQELEAYILDKARELRLEVTAELELREEDRMPQSVYLKGDASPYARQEMMRFLQDDLGIREENIRWTQ